MKRKIVVIGSNSFSGSDLVDLLLEDEQNQVVGISRSPEKSVLFLPYKSRTQPDFQFHQLDLNKDMAQILELLDTLQPQFIINFAAQGEVGPSWDHPEQWFQTNVVAIAELVNALRERTYLERYVHISSPEVYGTCDGKVDESAPLNPSTPYAASKAAADLFLSTMVNSFQFPLVTIRSSNVYGAHQQLWKIIPRSALYLRQGKRIPLHGGGIAVKSFIHIRDVSRGELAAMEHGETGAIYHLSSDQGYRVRDVVQRMCGLMSQDFEDATEVVGDRLGQDAAYLIDSSRAHLQLGWRPTKSLDEGLAEVVGWVQENWDEMQRQPLEYDHQP